MLLVVFYELYLVFVSMRVQSLDFFRIVAAFLVVSLHVNWPIEIMGPVMGDIAKIAVPYFYMLSGYFYKTERVKSTIKKMLLYTIVAMLTYIVVELIMFQTTMFISEELKYFTDYRFWICNNVPFCPVAWYLMSYVYILIVASLVKDKPHVHAVLGVISFLFALSIGAYSSVFGIKEAHSLMWNCSFLSTYCWFAMGRLLRIKKPSWSITNTQENKRNLFDGMLIIFILCTMGQCGEHYLLKKVTSESVSCSVFLSTLPAVLSLFLYLLRHPNMGEGLNTGKLPLFVFLSHVAINYVLISLFWPWKLDLSITSLFNLPFEPRWIVNNITVFVISCGIFSLYKRIVA